MSAQLRAALAGELREALAGDRLVLVHHPRVDLRRGAVCGVEARPGWAHPQLGPLAPSVVMTLPETPADARALAEWMLDRALAEQGALVAAGRPLPVSLALPGRLLRDEGAVTSILIRASAAAAPLGFEVAESALMTNPEATLEGLRRTADAGITLALTGHGAGPSSLPLLKRCGAAELKLDRTLFEGLADDARDARIVRASVDMAHALGMRAAADGVVDAATLAALTALGCDRAQGPAVSPGLPFAALKAFLAARDSAAASTRRERLSA